MPHRFGLTAALLLSSLLGLASLAQAASEPKGTPEMKKTITDTRNVGTAMYNWYQDQMKAQPKKAAMASGSEITAVEMGWVPVISREALAKVLVPKYIAAIPETDGWGHPYEYRLETQDLSKQRIMAIRSGGSDGHFSGDSYTVGAFSMKDEGEDLVWMDGYFARWPQAGATPKK